MGQHSRFNAQCPVPLTDYPRVLLAHGGGGRLMHQLINKMFVSTFGADCLQSVHDSAVVKFNGSRLAFTTDSYVVKPLFFPGGDIGSLAVNGTVNDLAMAGARPLYISVSFILEEGLEMEELWKIVISMKAAADCANIDIVTGDTKVVEKGMGDGIYINTSGVGSIDDKINITPKNIRYGDRILVNGDLGRHGIAIMAVREGLEFESAIESDSVPLSGVVTELFEAGVEIHCMRDLTRGGLASAVNEIADVAGISMVVDEASVPIREDVRGACEILGFDPLYVANEGRFVVFVAANDVNKALEIMRRNEVGTNAALIGEVLEESEAMVYLKSTIGATRILDMISGEQLPRIC